MGRVVERCCETFGRDGGDEVAGGGANATPTAGMVAIDWMRLGEFILRLVKGVVKITGTWVCWRLFPLET